MAFEFSLTDGVTSINLVYDAAAQTAWRLQQGMSLGGEEVLVTLHQGDFEPPIPILGTNPVRTGIFAVDIKPGTADGTLNKEAMLRRWIDGEDQQALRYHTTGDVRKIYLKVRNQGATSYTYHDVLWGNVNSAAAYYSNAAQVTQFARSVMIQVYLEATGYGDTITLLNELKNPAFLIGASGLASNWNETGTPVTTLGGSNLIGGQGQRVNAASAGHGVYSDTVSNPAYNDAIAYAWVYVESGTAAIALYDVTAGATVQSKTVDATDSGGNSDRSCEDENGATWYRIVVSGTFTAGNDMRLQATASGAAAIFNLDACYLQFNTDGDVPEGWASHKTIYNRMDQDTTNPERLNYIDTWGLPGDALADVRYQVTAGASSLGVGLILARGIGDAIISANADNQNHWLESADGTAGGTSNATWSTVSAADYSGGSVRRLTASSDGGTGTITWTISGDSARQFLKSVRAVWVQLQASSTTPTVTFSCTVGAADYARAYTANPLAAGSVLHVNTLGILNGQGVLPESVPDTNKPDLSFALTIAAIPNAATVDIDGIWLFYGDEEDYTIWTLLGSGFGNSDVFWVDGLNGGVINQDSGVFEPSVLGSQKWRLNPGQIHNRTLFLTITNTTQFTVTITHDFTVETIVRPRTRHLLGTLGAITP